MNPQKATAYVGPGVLRKGGKITPVPNGPLVKKKGEFKGSTLKAGGVIKKAQAGTKLSPQQKRAQMDSIAAVRRADIVRKKDSILNRNAAARGMTREQVRAQQEADKKKPNAALPGLQTNEACKRGDSKGSCATGQTNKGESLKDTKRNGGPIKKAQSGTSQYSDPKPLYDKIKKTKDSINDARIKLEQRKYKSKMNYLDGKLKNEESLIKTRKIKKAKSGDMIKRADGSYSKRGLWDNLRSKAAQNKKTGAKPKSPTKAMLTQEKKIKAKK
jgi:hypothetical protein